MPRVASAWDGTSIAVDAEGPPDAPHVVLVHGLGLSRHSWGPVPELLAREHRVVRYDLRGHGSSGTAPGGDYSLAAHAADLTAVLEAVVPADAPTVLVGHSLGGGIIVSHAARGPDRRVVGAVFVGSSGAEGTFPGLPAQTLPAGLQRPVRLAWLALLRGAAHLGRRLRTARRLTNWIARQAFFTADAATPAVDEARRDFLATDADVLAGSLLATFSDDHTRLAPQLTVPTLVLRGDRDREVTPTKLDALVAALPQAEVVTLPGGHNLPLTCGDLVADHVARWVATVRRREREQG